MNLKTRLFAGATTLALVGGIAAIGAQSASAAPPAPSPTVVDHCTNNFAIAQIKNPTAVVPTGIVNTLTNVKIGTKATGAPSCVGAFTGAGAIDAASFKTSIVGEASCNTALTPPAPPVGKFGFTQGAGTVKEQGYLRFASIDPTGVYFYSDVVNLHGFIAKGPAAGLDVDGSVFQNPTVKDKTLPQDPRFPGYDVNPFDSLEIGASCLSGTSAGNLLFNDGSGATCTTKCKPIATNIQLTLVGDGTSILEAFNGGVLILGAGGGNHPAEGITFSVY